MPPLISICVPTYNGAATLPGLLDSLLPQLGTDSELVLCDDGSSDDSHGIARDWAARDPRVRAERNPRNLGMDGNFARAARLGRGEYVWFSGQDDVFEPGAVDRLRAILARHPGLDLVYFNYRFKDDGLAREVAPPPLSLAEDRLFANAAEYFDAIDHAPSFLAATVMRRSYWESTPLDDLLGTHYVQVGVWLRNCRDARCYVVADPSFITCRVPEQSWKHRGGQMLFEIFSGSLEVYHRVFQEACNPLPAALHRRMMEGFTRALPNYVVFLPEKGYRLTPLIARRLAYLYRDRPLLYALYVWPLAHLPAPLAALARAAYAAPLTRGLARALRRLLGRAVAAGPRQ